MKTKEKSIAVINTVVSVAFLAFQYFVYYYVRFARDEYFYVHFSKSVIKSTWQYYLVGNGRWVINLIESFMLKFDRYALLIINPLLLLLLAFMIYKFISKLTYCSGAVYSFILVSFAALHILLSQEVVHWYSGAVTYLVSSVMFMGFMLAFACLRLGVDISTPKKILLGAVCVICTLSMEQFALMQVGFLTVWLIRDIVKFKKIRPAFAVIYMLCIIAMLTIIFAPGNFVRVDNSSGESAVAFGSIMQGAVDALSYMYHSASAIRFAFVLCVLEMIILISRKKILFSVLNAVEAVIILVLTFTSFSNIVLSAAGFLLFIVITVFSLRTLCEGEDFFCLTALFVMALLSQAFYLIDTFHSGMCYRLSFPLILMYIILISYMLAKLGDTRSALIAVSALMLFVNIWGFAACAVLTAIAVLIKGGKAKILQKTVFTIAAVGVICLNLLPIGLKYSEFAAVTDYNEARLRSGDSEIVLYGLSERARGGEFWTGYMAQVNDDKVFSVQGSRLSYFWDGYTGNVMREYYGLSDDQVVTYVEIDNISDLPEIQ